MTVTLKMVLYPTIVFFGALALFAFRNAQKIFAKYRKVKEVEHDPEWDGFIRKDFNKWD